MRYQKGEINMLNTIKALYRGEIAPTEECEDLTGEAEGIEEQEENLLARLKKSLTKEQAELLDTFLSVQNELAEIKKEYCFAAGFRLGAKLTAECYLDEKRLS